MAATIDSPAKCELRSVIRFLQVEGNSAAEIHRRMSRVYGETFMSDGVVREWCRKFKGGRTDVHDEGWQRRKSVATEDIVQRVDQVIREKRRKPYLAPSDFHLLPELKKLLGRQRFQANEELQNNVKAHLNSLAATFYEEGIGKLVHRYDKCLNLHGDYVEK